MPTVGYFFISIILKLFQFQLRRNSDDAEIRQPRQEHQEQAEDQRGPEGRVAARVPGGDRQTESAAVKQVLSPVLTINVVRHGTQWILFVFKIAQAGG